MSISDVSSFWGSPFWIVRRWREVAILLIDATLAAVALWAALSLRFDGVVPEVWRGRLLQLVVTLAACRVVANAIFRLQRWSFRLSGLADGARVWGAAFLGTGLFVLVLFLMKVDTPPRSVVIMELMLSAVAMVMLRFSPRLTSAYVGQRARSWRRTATHTVIVGAGSAGELLLRDLLRSDEHMYAVVGFVDDDLSKRGMRVAGIPVLGTINDLPVLIERYHIEVVLIAIPRLPASRVREMLSLCSALNVHFKILPVSFVYLNERGGTSMLQDLQPEDLLPRDAVEFSESGDRQGARGRSALVTGAAGSIGAEICRQLLSGGVAKLVMVDMDENGLYLMLRQYEREFPDSETIAAVGDIRDRQRLLSIMKKESPQDVFHAAAHKHVPLMEDCPCEAVKNNIMGTQNVAEASVAIGAERFIYISTDKAVRPTSVMGASKRVGEMIIRSMAQRSKTRFCAVRFGNVLGSAGSVVPLFRKQIASGGPVTVTHPDVRRYFMTIAEAVGLVLQAGYGDYGELCVLDMGEQIRIVDLARHMITMAGGVPDLDIPIVFTGLRPGEKLFEELLTEEEEQTSRVAKKIFSCSGPRVRSDLPRLLRELAAAAAVEDHAEVRVLLEGLVPSYVRPPLDAMADRLLAGGVVPAQDSGVVTLHRFVVSPQSAE